MSGENTAERREALLSLLHASEARRSRLSKRRLPTLAPGVRIGIRSGLHAGSEGTILDADFIQNQVLVDTPEAAGQVWIKFRHLAPPHVEDH